MLHRDINHVLLDRQNAPAEASVARRFADHPHLETRHDTTGREQALHDTLYRLVSLAEAIANPAPPPCAMMLRPQTQCHGPHPIGGYPFNLTSESSRQVGANKCTPDAEEAMRMARQIAPTNRK
jgi:hypothetical protein